MADVVDGTELTDVRTDEERLADQGAKADSTNHESAIAVGSTGDANLANPADSSHQVVAANGPMLPKSAGDRVLEDGARGSSARKKRKGEIEGKSGVNGEGEGKGESASGRGGGKGASGESCGFWFCGNHIPETAALRVPCPVDPSHTILASEVQSHVAKCPAAVQRGLTEGAAYFKGGLNARGPPLGGSSSSTAQAGGHAAADSNATHAHIAAPTTAAAVPGPGGQGTAASASAAPRVASAAAARRQMVAALGEGEWQRLLRLLGEAHAVAFGGHSGVPLPPLTNLGEHEPTDMVLGGRATAAPAGAAGAAPLFTLQQSMLWPPACDAWEQAARDMGGSVPFELRHVKQQASILANLARVGLLRPLVHPRTVQRPGSQTGAQAEGGALVQGGAQGGSTAGHVKEAEQAGAGRAGQQRGGEEAEEARPLVRAAAMRHGGEEPGRQGEEKGLEVPVEEGESRGYGAVDEEGDGKGEGRVYVELGAGRGYLTHMLCSCFHARHVVMVERRAYKFKADRALRKLSGVNLMRVRVDIADLQLAALPGVKGRPLVAISKHLCGPATDLALRCCLNASQTSQPSQPVQQGQPSEESQLNQGQQEPNQQGQQGQPSEERQQGARLAGLAIATCCHHLCDWESYVNPAFFTRLGFSPPDFAAVAWMSSWALLGEGKGAGGVGEGGDGESMGRGEEGQAAGEEVGGTAAASSGVVPSAAAAVAAAKRNGTVVGKEGVEEDQPQEAAAEAEAEAASRPTPWFAQLSVEQKVQVGRACKLLIDAGRLEWLQGRGLGVEYVEYTTVDLTPENRMLLAVGSQEKQKDAFGSRLQ
ncbi:unnamed protein product [Closterium sp. NIES-54]